MEFKDRARFKALKARYALDMALAGQTNPDLIKGMDDDQMFEAFLLFESEATIVEAINNHLEADSSAGAVCSICLVLASTIHKLLDQSALFLTDKEINNIKTLVSRYNYEN
jgi:hypothetical protein